MNAMTRSIYLLLFSFLWLGFVPRVSAQAAAFRHELMSLLPDDFAVCVVMHDLRGQAARWEQSGWLKEFRKSPLGKTFLEAPELQQLVQAEKDLKKHFDLDWPTLRDDILGDTVVLSYSSGPDNKPEDERGLFLIHARKPARLQQFIDQLNRVQKESGELKSLTLLQHKDKTYYRRVQGSKTHYYFLEDALLAVSSREELIRGVLDKKPRMTKEHTWASRFRKAGAEQAFVTLCVNPRAVQPEFVKSSKKDDNFPKYWQSLEGIFVSISIKEEAELRLSIQANIESLPKWTRGAFTETLPASTLWQRFPERSIVTLASQTDFAGLVEALQTLMPAKDSQNMVTQLQRTINALWPVDLFKDVLPNIGPDWGVCVFPAQNAQHLPHALIAIAVKPGTKDPPIDQSIYKAMRDFAPLALLDYNRKNPEAMIRVQTVKQDKVEITYLSNDKLFPAGIQPAWALKEGFLLFASAPEAIAQFRLRETKADQRPETPLFALSTQELAKLLRQRQHEIVTNLQQRQRMPEKEAQKNVESVLALLELFERVTLSQHADAGQASWTLRITPALKQK